MSTQAIRLRAWVYSARGLIVNYNRPLITKENMFFSAVPIFPVGQLSNAALRVVVIETFRKLLILWDFNCLMFFNSISYALWQQDWNNTLPNVYILNCSRDSNTLCYCMGNLLFACTGTPLRAVFWLIERVSWNKKQYREY